MKTKSLPLVILFLLAFGCKKNEQPQSAATYNPDSSGSLSLAEVRSWYQEHSRQEVFGSGNQFSISKLDLNWSQAKSIPGTGSNYWSIALSGQPTVGKVKLGYRKIVFVRDTFGVIRARIVEIVPDVIYWQQKGEVATKDFTGYVYVFDETYHFLNGRIYSGGKQIGESKPASQTGSDPKGLQINSVQIVEDCGWHDSHYLDAEGNLVIHSDRICNYTIYDDGLNQEPVTAIDGEGPYGSGGAGGGDGYKEPEVSNLPGEDHSKINPRDYVRCFSNLSNTGATMSVTLYVQQPFPGTVFNLGPNSVGHVAVGLSKINGNTTITQTVGFYPDASGKSKLHSPSKVVDNGGGLEYNLSITYQVSATQFQAILDYINTPPPTYDLVGNNCTNFAIEAVTNGGITPPNPYSAVGLNGAGGVQTAMTPAGLGDSISKLQGQNGVNTKGGIVPASKGPCN